MVRTPDANGQTSGLPVWDALAHYDDVHDVLDFGGHGILKSVDHRLNRWEYTWWFCSSDSYSYSSSTHIRLHARNTRETEPDSTEIGRIPSIHP
jgi:hypothetical protein